jgi:penicillin-binding protein 2
MLEDKVPPESFTTFCPGYATFYGRQFKCWVYGKSSHGVVGLHKAILESCDIFFYNVGMRLGIDRLSYYGSKLGIGHKTGIDLPSEEQGLMPSAEWVERVFHRKWYAGETISVSTGQGAVTTTPLQLARMIGGIAMGGVFKQPHLLKDAPNVGEERDVRRCKRGGRHGQKHPTAGHRSKRKIRNRPGDRLFHARARGETEAIRR